MEKVLTLYGERKVLRMLLYGTPIPQDILKLQKKIDSLTWAFEDIEKRNQRVSDQHLQMSDTLTRMKVALGQLYVAWAEGKLT